MGTGPCKVVAINGGGLSRQITQLEVEIYQNAQAMGKAISEETESMRTDFETRLRFGATMEAGPLALELPERHVFASGSFFVPLKAAAAAGK